MVIPGKLKVEFYKTSSGSEPVREWLKKDLERGGSKMSEKGFKKENRGSDFDEFLKDEGILEHCEALGHLYARERFEVKHSRPIRLFCHIVLRALAVIDSDHLTCHTVHDCHAVEVQLALGIFDVG